MIPVSRYTPSREFPIQPFQSSARADEVNNAANESIKNNAFGRAIAGKLMSLFGVD